MLTPVSDLASDSTYAHADPFRAYRPISIRFVLVSIHDSLAQQHPVFGEAIEIIPDALLVVSILVIRSQGDLSSMTDTGKN